MEYCPPPQLEMRLRRAPLSVGDALDTAIRIAGAVESTRLELRSVDPMANPYIAMAVLLEVGLHGVENKIEVPTHIIFLLLFGFSLYDMGLAEHLAEVEPFKTAIILKFGRAWPYVAFALTLLLIGLFIERFYCRYLCPIGAASDQ